MALSDLPISSNPTNPLAAQLYLPPPPVVLDPEASSYNTLIARLAAEVRPSDLPEQIWLREVADHIWEIGRVRRAKVSTIEGATEEGLRLVLDSLGVEGAAPLAARWAAGDADAVKAVDATLARAELGMGPVRAQALCLQLDRIERLDRLEGDAIARRDQAIRDIRRHRAQFAEALRRAALAAEEGATRDGGQAAPQPETKP
jgi:hypothetical protein